MEISRVWDIDGKVANSPARVYFQGKPGDMDCAGG
jgi:hypothetical protein